MSDPLDDIFKMCGSAGTMVTGGWGFIGKIQKRFGQIQDISERGGQPGPWFFLTYTVFQYVYAVALIVCGLAGLGLLVGGIAKIVSSPDGVPYLTTFFDDYAFQVLALAILIVLVALLNALSWIAILLFVWVPAKVLPLKQTAAWYNLWQFSLPLAEPKPIFISPGGISSLADVAITRLETNGSANPSFASTPTALSLDERANAALFGCLLEKEHSVRRWPKPNWDVFYEAVAAAEVNSQKVVSPAYLVGLSTDADYYAVLTGEVNRRLPQDQPKLPDSAEARIDLARAVDILVKEYRGSARNLAFRWRGRKPKLRLAFNRAQSFHPFDVSSMVPQFLKLSVRWGVWPNVKPGNFIYPYASNLALLLFEKRAMLTLATVKSLAFKQAGQLAAYRETMRRTVRRVRDDLSASKKPQHRQILKTWTTEWELASAVDFVLWSYSSEMKKSGEFKQWKLDENGFVTRKGEIQAETTEDKDEASFPKED